MHYHEIVMKQSLQQKVPTLFTNIEWQSVLRTSFRELEITFLIYRHCFVVNDLNGKFVFEKTKWLFELFTDVKKETDKPASPAQKNKQTNKQTKTKHKKVVKSILKSFTLIIFHVTFQEKSHRKTKNKHFLLPDMHTYVCFSENLASFVSLEHPF